METKAKLNRRRAWAMLSRFFALSGFTVAMLGFARAAQAQVALAYSFESGVEGFGPNGVGIAVTQDTIGATEGVSSMKVDIVQGATFVGALTAELHPDIGDPPGMNVVLFDLTITEQFPSEPGDFVDAGITIFGATQPDFPGGQLFGLQAQFLANQFQLGALEAGTHPIRMDLLTATHPVTFVDGSFNDIFGEIGSGANDLIPSGFQIYINKSSTAPWTGYIDNIRVGNAPPAADADFNDDETVDGVDLSIWEGAFGVNAAGDADGDSDSDGRDFLVWQRQFVSPAVGVAAVPEPATIGLAGAVLLTLLCTFRRTST